MTVRERHSRRNDHLGTMKTNGVDCDALSDGIRTQYPARTPLDTVLSGLVSRLPARKAFFANAVTKRTMAWPRVMTTLYLDAVIGTAAPTTWFGGTISSAVIKKFDIAHSFTSDARIDHGFKADAVKKKNSGTKTFTANAKIV